MPNICFSYVWHDCAANTAHKFQQSRKHFTKARSAVISTRIYEKGFELVLYENEKGSVGGVGGFVPTRFLKVARKLLLKKLPAGCKFQVLK